MNQKDEVTHGIGSLERAISIVVIVCMLAALTLVVFQWKPASAQGAPDVTIEVTEGIKDPLLGTHFGPTTFDPPAAEVPPGGTVKFVLVEGESATIESDTPPGAFVPESCSLPALDSECTVTIAPGVTGEIVYSDTNNSSFVAPSEGTLTVVGSSASPSATASSSTSATASPTASASASTSASPSPTASSTTSPSPTPSASPTPEPNIHERVLTLSLKKKGKKLVAKGFIASDDPGCYQGAPINVQKKMKGKWKKVKRPTAYFGHTTGANADGRYKAKIKSKKGKYRTRSPRYGSQDGMEVCKVVASKPVRFRK